MLADKTIFIISPQEWNTRPVSKHHYATEFAKKSKVYFLNPPKFRLFFGSIKIEEISSNLNVITITLPVPSFIKFKAELFFQLLFRNYLKSIIQSIESVDYLWNFDNGTYFKNHNLFDKAVKVFHPVDDFSSDGSHQYSSYDIGFSVSEQILDKIPLDDKYFINHGLQNNFVKNKQSDSDIITPNNITYVGNISIKSLDTNTLKRVILDNCNLYFSFIGDYDNETDFINFLKTQENVKLFGNLYAKDLQERLLEADILLLCYKKKNGYFADNSHKLLEYLSTGNVVVSSKLSVYQSLDLFPMSKTDDNSDFLNIFNDVIENFDKINSKASRLKRVQYAFDNTYSKQIERIENMLTRA